MMKQAQREDMIRAAQTWKFCFSKIFENSDYLLPIENIYTVYETVQFIKILIFR